VWLREINIWINYKECGYLDTSPREIKIGHSSAVRLRLLRMEEQPKIEIPRHLSEGFKEWATQAPFGLDYNV
jgi:hypothetical protein